MANEDSGVNKRRFEQASDKVRAAGFEPLEPYPGNNRTLWRCTHIACGNEIQLKLGGVVSGKNPCQFCNGQWVDPEHAVSVMLSAGLKPLEPYVSNKHGWRCRCLTCGATVFPRYNTVLSNGGGCKFCGKSRAASKRRLSDEAAKKIMLDAGYEALEPYRNSQAKWRCRHLSCGRVVLTQLTQVRAGHGACRHCAGVIVEAKDALRIMREAGYEPLEPYVSSRHKWRCRCMTCGRETHPTYGEARTGSRCKYCARKAITPEDARTLMKASGFEPLEPYPGSMEPWLCRHLQCGELTSPRYAHVQQGRRACRTCSWTSLSERNRLDQDTALAIMQEAGLDPLEPYPGNNKPWRCIHIPCGREVTPSRASISQGQGGCRACAQERLASLFRIPDEVAIQIMSNAGFVPLTPYPGRTHAPWEALCRTCSRQVSPTLSNVKSGATCIYCAGRRIVPSEAEQTMRRAGLEPLEPYPGKHQADWRCRHLACGREVVTRYSLIRDGNSGCVFCNGGRIHPDDALHLMAQRGLEPLEPFPGTSRKWKCRHVACGRIVHPTYSNVTQGGGGCKACSDSSFAYDAPGVVYLLLNETFSAVKIGITTTSARTNRIRDHERAGWTLQKKWHTKSGFDAELVETAILSWWRNVLGAPVALKREDMPSGGFTETAPLVHVDLAETALRVEHYLGQLS
jgi:hypothetical protein